MDTERIIFKPVAKERMTLPILNAAALHERGELEQITDAPNTTLKLWPEERLIVIQHLRGGVAAEWRGVLVLVPAEDFTPETGAEASFIE
jgi:hypothetical protein